MKFTINLSGYKYKKYYANFVLLIQYYLSMYIALGLMFVGLFAGRLLQNRIKMGFSTLIMAVICILLFILGLELGYNNDLVSKFASIGTASSVIAVCVVIGSCLAAKILYKFTSRETISFSKGSSDGDGNSSVKGGFAAMKGSLMILGAFLIGLILAIFDLMPYGEILPQYSKWVLYLLMFLVGVSLGLDKSLIVTIKSQPKRMLVLPLFTMAGTFAGAVAAYFIMVAISGLSNSPQGLSLLDSLSVSAGFGYYSLSSIFLNEARGAELGTIALAANILRELFTIMLAPLMVRYFGKLAPISSGGATSMDTSLPVIQTSCGNRFVPVAIFHGVTVDFSVPFFLTLFLSLY